jgi:hypothetical protein
VALERFAEIGCGGISLDASPITTNNKTKAAGKVQEKRFHTAVTIKKADTDTTAASGQLPLRAARL